MTTRLTLARSIWKSIVSLTIGYGFCASGARPGGQGRSGDSAAQRCTCESTMCMEGSPLRVAQREVSIASRTDGGQARRIERAKVEQRGPAVNDQLREGEPGGGRVEHAPRPVTRGHEGARQIRDPA